MSMTPIPPSEERSVPADRSRQSIVAFGPFVFDRSELELKRSGSPIRLPERSLRLLEVLLRSPQTTWSKDRLIGEVWTDSHVADTSLTEAMSRLRAALRDSARAPRYIETVHRRGYRFVAPVQPATGRPPASGTQSRLVVATVAVGLVASVSLLALLTLAIGSGAVHTARSGDLTTSAPLWLVGPVRGVATKLLGLAPASRAQTDPLYRLARVSQDGRHLLPYSVPPMPLNGFSVEPRRGRIAFSVRDEGESDAWIYEPDRGALTRIATGGYFSDPVWSPAGDAVTLAAKRTGSFDLVRRAIDRPGVEEVLLDRPLDQFPESWSADGRVLIFAEKHPETGYDLWALEQRSDRSWRPRPLVRSPNDEAFGAISPDGRYVAYVTRGESGPAVFLADRASDRSPVRVSADGASYPFWSPDGSRLHFLLDEQVQTVALTRTGSPPTIQFEETHRISGLYLAGLGRPGGGYTVAMLQ